MIVLDQGCLYTSGCWDSRVTKGDEHIIEIESRRFVVESFHDLVLGIVQQEQLPEIRKEPRIFHSQDVKAHVTAHKNEIFLGD